MVAGPDSTLQSQPANAIKKALDREGISVDQLDVVEINEAFAAVALASTRELGMDPEIVNVNGGAIAVGPRSACLARGSRCTWRGVGPPRCRIRRRGAVRAGGQGDALILRAGY